MLDLGLDVGAAVVTAGRRFAGEEIEFRAADGAWDGRHVAFRRRRLPDRTIVAAVLPGLTQGSWEARVRGDGTSLLRFDVAGGRVTRVAGPS